MAVFFLVSFGLLALIYGYLGMRLIVPARLAAPWSLLAWGVLVLFLVLPHTSILFRIYGYEGWWSTFLEWLTFLSLGFSGLLFFLVVARDLVWLVTWGLRNLVAMADGLLGTAANPAPPANPDRRRLLVRAMNLGLLGSAGILTGYGLYEARRRPRVVEIRVPIEQLPDDLVNFRIVQITDIHAGSTIKRDYVQAVVDQVKELPADVIALTGDLVDSSVPHLRYHVRPLQELSAPSGCYFVTGNHEYYAGVEAWIEEVDRLGFTVLLNEHRLLERGAGRLLLAGITDYSAGRYLPSHVSDPQAALDGAPLSHVKILLAHQPRSIFAAARAGFDLQLSGHTHGGQLFPWHFFVGLMQPYLAGLHKHDKTWIYVSRGVGYWGPPLRLGAPAEITLVTLTRVDRPEAMTGVRG